MSNYHFALIVRVIRYMRRRCTFATVRDGLGLTNEELCTLIREIPIARAALAYLNLNLAVREASEGATNT